jgi:hypothetical protein
MKTITLDETQLARFQSLTSPESTWKFWHDIERHFAVSLRGNRKLIVSVRQSPNDPHQFNVTSMPRKCRFPPPRHIPVD